ncbi:MAG: OmpA family protein [Pseudomonadales bacterium]|nr:OmpA family protein [Pseudomonadales bacterium]
MTTPRTEPVLWQEPPATSGDVAEPGESAWSHVGNAYTPMPLDVTLQSAGPPGSAADNLLAHRRERAQRLRLRLAGADNRGRWLVSYADFMTLLFGFFVVMYAISSVNEEKYKELSATLSGIFESVPLTDKAVQIGEPQTAVSSDIVPVADTPAREEPVAGDTKMRTSRDYAQSTLGGFADAAGMQIASNDHWLEISLDSELAFAQGSASLRAEAARYLKEISAYLKSFPNPVTIEGYTDNVPAENSRFGSNWQLSAARAAAVADYLSGQGIDSERLSSVGYGENHPIATNATPEGRARNRRVVLVVAHNGNLPRNLNTAPETSAFAFVRHADDNAPVLPQRRTGEGGLLFTNDEAAPVSAP